MEWERLLTGSLSFASVHTSDTASLGSLSLVHHVLDGVLLGLGNRCASVLTFLFGHLGRRGRGGLCGGLGDSLDSFSSGLYLPLDLVDILLDLVPGSSKLSVAMQA